MVSGLLLYLPLSGLLVVLGLREGLFTGSFVVLTVAVAAAFHIIEVGHSVFQKLVTRSVAAPLSRHS